MTRAPYVRRCASGGRVLGSASIARACATRAFGLKTRDVFVDSSNGKVRP